MRALEGAPLIFFKTIVGRRPRRLPTFTFTSIIHDRIPCHRFFGSIATVSDVFSRLPRALPFEHYPAVLVELCEMAPTHESAHFPHPEVEQFLDRMRRRIIGFPPDVLLKCLEVIVLKMDPSYHTHPILPLLIEELVGSSNTASHLSKLSPQDLVRLLHRVLVFDRSHAGLGDIMEELNARPDDDPSVQKAYGDLMAHITSDAYPLPNFAVPGNSNNSSSSSPEIQGKWNNLIHRSVDILGLADARTALACARCGAWEAFDRMWEGLIDDDGACPFQDYHPKDNVLWLRAWTLRSGYSNTSSRGDLQDSMRSGADDDDDGLFHVCVPSGLVSNLRTHASHLLPEESLEVAACLFACALRRGRDKNASLNATRIGNGLSSPSNYSAVISTTATPTSSTFSTWCKEHIIPFLANAEGEDEKMQALYLALREVVDDDDESVRHLEVEDAWEERPLCDVDHPEAEYGILVDHFYTVDMMFLDNIAVSVYPEHCSPTPWHQLKHAYLLKTAGYEPIQLFKSWCELPREEQRQWLDANVCGQCG